MSPEAASHLAVADIELAEAKRAFTHQLTRMAARAAYYAAFRAAEALIVERTGKVAKTHTGVRAEFARLWRALPHADQSLTKILSRGYSVKEKIDYDFEPAVTVDSREAATLLAEAEKFVGSVRREPASSSGTLAT